LEGEYYLQYSPSQYLSLPSDPGVYQFFDKAGNILYVGKAKNLRSRVSSYFTPGADLFGKTRLLVEQVKKIKVIVVESEFESLLLEANLIKKFSPKYNIRLTDGKAYPLIRITIHNIYPAVLTARRIDDEKSLYFGPFPNAGAMRMVLRTIRRIFPFQSVLNHPKRICLYHHLGLCPCVPAFEKNDSDSPPKQSNSGPSPRAMYKKNVRHIVNFLEGDTKKVLKELEKERSILSTDEHFEDAAKIQKQIDAITEIIHPFHKPFEYETNPNLRTDLRTREMEDLQRVLVKNNQKVNLPRRIECYDNSNFQGSNPTSSMVVLTDGEIDKSQYRKFKIKTVIGPNDFASMEEVLRRRLNHPEWPYPDLIIVDGGKGQVSAAKKALSSLRGGYDEAISNARSPRDFSREKSARDDEKYIPLIGLAKREEIIITSDLKEIILPKRSPALQLVMRIRDEAHRFAITYHRKLRSKNFISS